MVMPHSLFLILSSRLRQPVDYTTVAKTAIMFGVGIPELMVIFLVALVILGPKQLPEVAKFLGKALGEFRKATDEISAEFNNAKTMLEEEVRQAERAAQEEKISTSQKGDLSSSPPAEAQPEAVSEPTLTPPQFTVAQTKKEPPTGESA